MIESISLPILQALNVSRRYTDGQISAVDNLSLDIQAGEYLAIMGASGSGKSTLLNMLGGLDLPTAGEIRYRGRSLSQLNLDEYRSKHIGFVFQSFHLIPTLTALENVAMPLLVRGEKRAAHLPGDIDRVPDPRLAVFADQTPGRRHCDSISRLELARRSRRRVDVRG